MNPRAQVPWVLTAAFTLSIIYTVWSWVAGVADEPASVPSVATAAAVYVVGFAAAALSRRRSRAAQWLVLGIIALFLVVAVAVYPSQFGPRQQTLIGWLENDAYVGLLAVAAYLTVVRLVEERRGPADPARERTVAEAAR